MPKTKDGGFLLDDSDLEPYKVPPKKDIKPNKPETTRKKSKTEKKK